MKRNSPTFLREKRCTLPFQTQRKPNLFAILCWTKYCRESTEHGDDDVSERTSPQKSLEEEYLETE
jgi:hypothetical protein